MEKFPQQENHKPNFGDKTKKLFKGVVVGTMVGVGVLSGENADAQTYKNDQSHNQKYIEKTQEVKIGGEIFTVKKTNEQFHQQNGPLDKVFYRGHSLDLFYGSSMSHNKSPFEVTNMYLSSNNPKVLIIEGYGSKPVETTKDGELFVFFAKQIMKIYYKKDNSGVYTEIAYKDTSEDFLYVKDEINKNWEKSTIEPN